MVNKIISKNDRLTPADHIWLDQFFMTLANAKKINGVC